MPERRDSSRLTLNFKPPPPFDFPDDQRPQNAIIREVDLSSNPTKISVKFSRANFVRHVPTMDDFQELLRTIGSGNYDFPRPVPAPPRRKFKSPLSLYNKEYNYIIYILNRNKNWEFSSDIPPISIEQRPDGAYYEAAHIYRDGRIKGEPGPKCRAAYFIAKAPVDPATGETVEYEDAINLHVDLLYEDENGDETRMPLLIDPDVRYPGGSGSP